MKKLIKKNYLNYFDQINTINLGKHSSWEWLNDPKHLVFSLSRYKFVSKLFFKFENVLEIGAGDGFKSQIIVWLIMIDTIQKVIIIVIVNLYYMIL